MILRSRAALSLAVIAGVALGLFILWAYPPSVVSFYPQCAFHRLTGLNCPGCGGTRCLHALLNGHPLEALRDNALILIALPFFVIGILRRWWYWIQGLPQPPQKLLKWWLGYTIAGIVIAFFILRNLPWSPFTWLSPGN